MQSDPRRCYTLNTKYMQSSHLLLICSPELQFLVLGPLFFEGAYILLYGGTPLFWQRGLWNSCFQNPSKSSVYDIQIGLIKCRKAQTAHSCNLVGAVINYFMTRLTNKIVPHSKCSFVFRVLVSLIMSFKILMSMKSLFH